MREGGWCERSGGRETDVGVRSEEERRTKDKKENRDRARAKVGR